MGAGGGLSNTTARVDSGPESSIDIETTAPTRQVYFIDNSTALNGMFICPFSIGWCGAVRCG